jgi:hypothetical protein
VKANIVVLIKSPENVIPAYEACPILDTGAGIYNWLKILDSAIKSRNDKWGNSTFYEFNNIITYAKFLLLFFPEKC